MRRRWKGIALTTVFVLVGVALFQRISAVFRPPHTDFGSTWEAYLCEPEDSIDVLFLGSSYAYCDWNPGIVYDASGLTSYVMGGSEQTPAITYYYLREALKTQTPSAVVMEGSSLLFHRYQNYTQVNVGYMPWGRNRVGAILNAAEPELRAGLFADIIFYHDRWKEITQEDVRRAFTAPVADDLKGYTAVDQVYVDAEKGPVQREMDLTSEEYEANLRDLEKIAQVCQENEMAFYVVINPTYSRYAPEVYETLKEDVLALAPEARFFNWSEDFERKGLIPGKHLYDGWHLNQDGAEIYSDWTGQFLLGEGLTPRYQSEKNTAAWKKTAAYWRAA